MLSTPPASINAILAGFDRARGDADGVHARAAQAVDGGARHVLRQTCQQQRHARDVAVVFAGLVGAAVDHVVDGAPVDFLVALHQRLERYSAKVVGTHRRQRTRIAADRRANRVAQESFRTTDRISNIQP
jgi:hypothetical protein